MIRPSIISLLAAFLCLSCATEPVPKPIYPEGTRVGIVNSLEPYLTHQHITVERINSFTKQIHVDWNIPAYLDTLLADSLKKTGRFVVVPIHSPQIQSQLNQLSDQIDTAATRGIFSKDLVDFIENTAKARDIDVIIMVKSFKGESPWRIGKNPFWIQGYGLLTRTTVLGAIGFEGNWVHPYAEIRVAVFKSQPVARLGSGQPKLKKGSMEGFKWPADIKNVPQTELDTLRPIIEQYAGQAVKNALQDANMVSF